MIEKTIEKKYSEINEDELNNTMVLSKIVVDMNSKTLAAISKKFEDTKTIEIIEDTHIPEEKKEIIKPTITNKKILLGKAEKNLIKKGLELKENEILELSKVILEIETLDSERKSIINKFIDLYIEYKYINQGELNKDCGIVQFRKNIENNITLFAETLIEEKNSKSYNNKIKSIHFCTPFSFAGNSHNPLVAVTFVSI